MTAAGPRIFLLPHLAGRAAVLLPTWGFTRHVDLSKIEIASKLTIRVHQLAALYEMAEKLLDEERIAIGARVDEVHDVLWRLFSLSARIISATALCGRPRRADPLEHMNPQQFVEGPR